MDLEGWLLGSARKGAEIELRWGDGETMTMNVAGDAKDNRWRVPGVPGRGRHRLSVGLSARPHGALVLDRFVVEMDD